MNYQKNFILSLSIASKSLEVSFILNCVLKRANDLKNDFKLTRFVFDSLKPFHMNRDRSRTRQTQNTVIINILLTSSSWSVL